jgi:hypothetical protein
MCSQATESSQLLAQQFCNLRDMLDSRRTTNKEATTYRMHQLSPQISAIVDLCACMKAYLQPSHCEFRSRFDAKHTAIGCLVEGI